MSESAELLFSPSADRNHRAVGDVLATILPSQGNALEIASGTGQHIVHFAGLQPELRWQPSDPDAASRASIASRIHQTGLSNIQAPIELDVRNQPWPIDNLDLVVCLNMIHIAPISAMHGLIAGAASALKPSGILFLYGPYIQDDVATAPGNLEFDQSLRSRNPEWGIRNLTAVTEFAMSKGFKAPRVQSMPANNLSLIFELDNE